MNERKSTQVLYDGSVVTDVGEYRVQTWPDGSARVERADLDGSCLGSVWVPPELVPIVHEAIGWAKVQHMKRGADGRE